MLTEKLMATRSRVETTNLFDELMLHELITPPQLQAANRLAEDLAAGRALVDPGTGVPSMETAEYHAGLRDTLASMSGCDTDDTACFINAITGTLASLPSHVTLEQFGKIVTHNLDCLSSHYGFDRGGQLDPRAVLRRQVRLG
jgi:hypothetical protein